MQAGTTPLDVSVAIFQKINKQPSSRHSNTTFGYTKGCSIMPQGHVLATFIATLFVIARTWKQSKCPLFEDLIKKSTIAQWSTTQQKKMTS